MLFGIVIGSVWSTRKQDRLTGAKLMVVKPVNLQDISMQNLPIVAVDTIGAGIGETVLVVTGSSARKAVGNADAPVDAAIVGIVDDKELDDRYIW